jgi:hypothetical protein
VFPGGKANTIVTLTQGQGVASRVK